METKTLPFTDAELLELAGRIQPNMLWQKAFQYYNADEKNKKVSIGCRPCFSYVLVYLLKIRLA